jgi:hypothetical protein
MDMLDMVAPSHQGYRSEGRFAVHAAAALSSKADAHRKLAGDSSGLWPQIEYERYIRERPAGGEGLGKQKWENLSHQFFAWEMVCRCLYI